MYFNEKHNQRVINRGDNYTYIGSYRTNEVTIDGKNKKGGQIYIRVKCPYCRTEYDVTLGGFINNNKCSHCCRSYSNSFAYYIQQELKEPLSKYWDWGKNTVNPYLISKAGEIKIFIKCTNVEYHKSYLTNCCSFSNGRRCPYCVNKKVHPKDSFGQWLIDTYGDDAIEKYWSPKNTLNPFTIAPRSSNKKVWILCQNKDYHNEKGGYLITPAHFYEGKRCPYCTHKTGKVHPKDSFAQWGIDNIDDDFLEKYWSKKNTLNPWKLAPRSNKHTIWIYCQEKDYHNDEGGYEIKVSEFYAGNRCPYCGNKHGKVHPKDSFGYLYPKKAKYWSGNNNKSPFEVAPKTDKEKYWFICESCGKSFKRTLNNLNARNCGVCCADCNNSQLEEITKQILNKYNINYKRDMKYDGLLGIGGRNLSYDFYLPDYNLLIELQGEQHEHFIKGIHRIQRNFERQLEHDKRKKQYAINHSINFLEIWYYDIDNIEDILTKQLNL